MEGSKIKPGIMKAAQATGQVFKEECKARGNYGRKLADALGIELSDLADHLNKGDFSYQEFLQICTILKMKAPDVFEKSKEYMPAPKAGRETPSMKVSPARSSKTSVPKTKSPVAKKEKSDATPPVNVDLEPVNDEEPDDIPFTITAQRAGVKGADAILLEWKTALESTRPLFASDEEYESYMARMPKPHKDSSDIISLDFGSATRKQEFLNLGMPEKLDEYKSEKGFDVLIALKPAIGEAR